MVTLLRVQVPPYKLITTTEAKRAEPPGASRHKAVSRRAARGGPIAHPLQPLTSSILETV